MSNTTSVKYPAAKSQKRGGAFFWIQQRRKNSIKILINQRTLSSKSEHRDKGGEFTQQAEKSAEINHEN